MTSTSYRDGKDRAMRQLNHAAALSQIPEG
jgi:hypothetical protein